MDDPSHVEPQAPKLEYARRLPRPSRRISNFNPYLWGLTLSFSVSAIVAGAASIYAGFPEIIDAVRPGYPRYIVEELENAFRFFVSGLVLIVPSVIMFAAAVRAWRRRFDSYLSSRHKT